MPFVSAIDIGFTIRPERDTSLGGLSGSENSQAVGLVVRVGHDPLDGLFEDSSGAGGQERTF